MRTTPPSQTVQQGPMKQQNRMNEETALNADVMEDSERSLHRVISSLGSYQATPITKHYALNNQILMAFESHYERKLFKVAYAIGLQFVETALLEIPKHGYFYSSRHDNERQQSSHDAQRVTKILQEIQEKEGNFVPAEISRVDKLAKLAREQAKPSSLKDYESDRAKVEAELRSTSGNAFQDFCGQFMIFDDICPPGRSTTSHIEPAKAAPSHPASHIQHSPRGESSRSSIPPPPPLNQNQALHYFDEMPRASTFPTIPSPDFLRTTSELELERALFLSGLEVHPRKPAAEEKIESTTNFNDSLQKLVTARIDMATLSELYREDFDSLLETGRVRISRVATYQGRIPGSMNGCTVIAPLLCIHHFYDQYVIPDPGLPDSVVLQTIDHETPEILRELRGSLGLTKDAFIIPSDAHDYLIGRQLLSQDQFVNVCGGNILDEDHVNNFVQVLASGANVGGKGKPKKIACTLFFHEHVVAIHKLERENGSSWYDIIDSLPLPNTLRQFKISNEGREGPPINMLELYGTEEFAWNDESEQNTARIRCLDLEALKATLRWYACSKFTKENLAYIDMYPWADMNTDFDPRVFQTFVWGEA